MQPTSPRLRAHGSLGLATLTAAAQHTRAGRTIEMLALFLGAPAAMSYAVFHQHIPLFVVLQPVLLGFVTFLLLDRSFSLKRELRRGFGLGALANIILIFSASAGLIAWATMKLYPHLFLSFPVERFRLWVIVMVFYPLLSVIAQELVYRTFFFHRYGALFGDRRWLAIVVNGVFFGYGHLIFGNAVAIVGTTVLGVLLAWRYSETRSFWAVWFEHTLYGWLVFTIGLGRFFFTGVATF